MEDSDKEELQNLREEVKQLREQDKKNGNNITKKVMIGIIITLIPLGILNFIGSYQGVMRAEKINKEKIKNNTRRIKKNETNIRNLEKDNQKQWKYIFEQSNTRGDEVN